MVYSASFILSEEKNGNGFWFIQRQLMFLIPGLAAFSVGRLVPYERWKDQSYAVLGFAMLLLALVYVPGIGAKVGGAQRWLRFGPLQFQPAEFAKFAVLVHVCRQLSQKLDRIKEFKIGLVAPWIGALPVALLLLLQPDFGSVALIAMSIYCVLFLAGVRWVYLVGLAGMGMGVGAGLIAMAPYRLARVQAFLDPWSDPAGKGFQIVQSLLGFHQGHIWGVGLGNGKEKLFYLPEAHNDFIFAVVGEELGFVGVAAVVLMFLFLIYQCLRMIWEAFQMRREIFGFLLGAGLTLTLGLQALINMAVVLGMLPTKGIPLPFLSYGGSSLILGLFNIGVLLNIAYGKSQSLPSR